MNLKELNHLISISKFENRSITNYPQNKIHIEEQEEILIGRGIKEITLLDAQNLVSNSLVQDGIYYKISGANNSLYGGTDLILLGVNQNNFSKKGIGHFYNPKYDLYPVLDITHNYNLNDKVIYGGYVWKMINSDIDNTSDSILNDGNPFQNFLLDTTWWLQITNNNIDYNEVWDEIEYDFQNDLIISRFESIANNLVSFDYATSNWFYCGINPISVFRWGFPYNDGEGLKNCIITESYFNCLNFLRGYIIDVTISKNSFVFNISLKGYSYIENLTLDNSSSLYDIILNNSSLYNINITDESSIHQLNFDNSSLYNLRAESNSNIYNINVIDSSINSNVLISSSLDNLTLNDANLHFNEFGNSNLSQINLVSAFIYAMKFNSSFMYLIYLNNAGIELNTLFNSGILFLTLNNNNHLNGMRLNSSIMDYGNQNPLPYSNNGAIIDSGTIIYQFSHYFDGSTGHGAVGAIDFPRLNIPNGYYFSEIIIDSDNLSFVDTSDAIINIGNSDVPDAAINDANGLLSNIFNKISCFNSSNEKCRLIKANGNSYLTAVIKTSGITNGGMNFSITLKQINAIYIND